MASARALLPMAIGVAVIGGFAWVLLTRDWALGPWLARFRMESDRAGRPVTSASTRYVALLRGINVGRAKAVDMAELRAIVESLGFNDVRTLLRSGNVVFTTAAQDPGVVARTLERRIEDRLAMKVAVVVRTANELAAVVDANPIPEATGEGSNLHVMFLAERLSDALREKLDPSAFEPDVVRFADREIYVWYRHGMSGSATALQLDRGIRSLVTDRNWNTVGKLLALTRTD